MDHTSLVSGLTLEMIEHIQLLLIARHIEPSPPGHYPRNIDISDYLR